ncbi:U3 snoRNP protein, partial [Linderina pennispora]
MKDTGFAAQLNTTGGANTYRFKSFKQRVEGIEINVSRRVKRDLDEPEEYDSYLAEAVLKWGELNCTNDFTELLRKIRDYHQSLAQVLYHKEQIVGVLEGYLSMDHEGVLEPVLDLVTTLARDLQDEFMPFYQQLVQRILPLMKVENPEIVEWSCNALAYLFKYLSKSLVANLSSTFDLVAPILGTERQKAHTRRFAAESLAFLIRKLRGDSLQTFVGHVVQALVACPDKRVAGFREGIALLFFECIRSVDGRLHSRASGLLTALLAELYKESCGRRLEDNQVYLLTLSIIKMCLHYVKRDTSEQIWSVLLSEYDAQVRAITGSKAGRLEPYCALLGLLASATILRKGSRVRDYKALFQRCQSAFEIASLVSSEKYKKPADEKCVAVMAHERIKWLSGLLLQSNVTEMVAVGRLLLDAVFESESMKTALSMALTLARLEWSQWNQILLPYLVQLTVSKWADHKNILLLFWAELFQLDMFKSSTASISSVITSRGQILFPSASGKKAKKAASTSVSQSLLQWLLEPIEWSDLLDHQITIPSGEATMFSGFDDSEDDNTSMASKSSSSGDSKNSVVSELSIKSAILSVLTNISIDASVLVDGLDSFCTQLSTSIVQITAQLAKDSEYLQHTSANAKQRYDIGPADGEIWGDEASEALGLHTAKDDRLYWGPYHQLHPLITLLGRAMALKATTAMHAPPASAATTLMNRWTDVVANILPTHYANPSLIDGVYQIADALKFVTTMNRGGSDAVPEEVKEQFASAMSTTQLEVVMRSVESNLVSVQPTLRLKTLQLLSLFDQLPLEESDEDSFSKRHGKKQPAEQCPAIQLAIELESTETSLAMYKEKLNHLRRLTV